MASKIIAGSATNAGIQVQGDSNGTLELVTGSGAGTTALTLDASQNATIAGTLTSGAITSSGVITSSTGALYPLVSGTAVTASGASVDFTGIPSTAKRITVQINGLSYAASGTGVIQIGAGSLSTSGYTGNITGWSTGATTLASVTTGFGSLVSSAASTSVYGVYVMTLVGANAWICTGQSNRIGDSVTNMYNGSITLGGTLDRLSLVATTSTFDAGSINIMWE